MARYTGPVCRLCRREGVKLFLKGDRCYSGKCAIEKRNYAPGQHGQRRAKQSEYGLQLREKQKAKFIYGVLEKPFRNNFEKAQKIKEGTTGDNMLVLLELRLDNVMFRLGYARTRKEARQIVGHKHVLVNGKCVNIPSYQVKAGDVISICEKGKNKGAQRYKDIFEVTEGRTVPSWLEADHENFTGKVVEIPSRDVIDVPVNPTLIVELYSK